MRRLPAALAHLLAAGLTARAAAAQLVTGRVVDSASRRPLPAVPVRLVRVAGDGAAPDTAAVARGHTAHDGVFTLVAPGPGTYRLHIAGGVAGPPLALASADSVDQHEYPVAPDLAGVFFEFQVDKPAAQVPGSIQLRYPTLLQSRNVEGKVLAQFVVGADGRAEMDTWKVLESSHLLFSTAVEDAVQAARFHPAQLAGRTVRQLVQFPVAFTLNRSPADPLYPTIPPWPGHPTWPPLPEWPDPLRDRRGRPGIRTPRPSRSRAPAGARSAPRPRAAPGRSAPARPSPSPTRG
jgi:TonB family protein